MWRLVMPPDGGGLGFAMSEVREMTLGQLLLLLVPKAEIERIEDGNDWQTLRMRLEMQNARSWTSRVKIME